MEKLPALVFLRKLVDKVRMDKHLLYDVPSSTFTRFRCMIEVMGLFIRPQIMGIINTSPDSFYPNSRHNTLSDIRNTATKMIRDGATLLDVGGESTKPGSLPVSTKEQIQRVIPAIKEIQHTISKIDNIRISVDTQSAEVAEAALDAGAMMVNDISALQADPSMVKIVAEREIPVVLMHMQGKPETMQQKPYYDDVVREVRNFFEQAVARALQGGIHPGNIILDPGIGFGKRLEDNLRLLHHLDTIRIDDFPLLVGLSRKSFLGMLLADSPSSPLEVNQRLSATIAAHSWCLSKGVEILRVHDVMETRDAIITWEALSWAS